MPSGAKKRKAAKKKLQKAHNNGRHSQANEDPRSHDDRESDGGDVNNHEEGTKEVCLGEENAPEIDDGELKKEEENMNEVSVESEEHKSSSSSGSSNSSFDNEEIVVEKENSAGLESKETVYQNKSSNPEGVDYEETPESAENLPANHVSSEIYKEESVPTEEPVKQVVSSQDVVVTESVFDENTMASETSGAGGKLILEEILPKLDEKHQISSVVTNLVEEKCDKNLAEPVDVTVRENEALLPPSSGVTTGERNGGGDHHVTESEKQPLVSYAPVPVRRTSWMDCCGLFETFSGSSSR